MVAQNYYTAQPYSSSTTPGKTTYGCHVTTVTPSASVTPLGGTLTMTVTFGNDTKVYTLHISPNT